MLCCYFKLIIYLGAKASFLTRFLKLLSLSIKNLTEHWTFGQMLHMFGINVFRILMWPVDSTNIHEKDSKNSRTQKTQKVVSHVGFESISRTAVKSDEAA